MGNNSTKDLYDRLIELIRSKYGLKNVEITNIDINLFNLANKLDDSTAICKVYKEGEVLICITKKGLIIEDLLDYHDETE